jgi:hypothetical protein
MRLLVTISAISALRAGTDRAKQPHGSVLTLGRRTKPKGTVRKRIHGVDRMKTGNSCRIDRVLLCGAGILMLSAAVVSVLFRDDSALTRIILGVAGVVMIGAGTFLPCHVVRRLTGGF